MTTASRLTMFGCLLSVVTFLFTAATATAAASAEAAASNKTALLPITASRLSTDVAEALDEHLAAALGRVAGYHVVTLADISAMMGLERMKDTLGCRDVSCAAELGNVLGVAFLIAAKATVLGDQFEITLTLIDVQTSDVVKRAQGTCQNDERHYAGAVDDAVAGLFGAPAAAASRLAELHITTSEDDSYQASVTGGDIIYACNQVVTAANPCSLRVPARSVTVVGIAQHERWRGLGSRDFSRRLNLVADTRYDIKMAVDPQIGLAAGGIASLVVGFFAVIPAVLVGADNPGAGLAVGLAGAGLFSAGITMLLLGIFADGSEVTHQGPGAL